MLGLISRRTALFGCNAERLPKIGISLGIENMIKLSYRSQVLILAVWIVVVTLLFKLISDRQIAALIAGTGFILLPLWILVTEVKSEKNKIHIFIILFFLLSSALPVFLLRVMNWGTEFNSLDILGVPAGAFHKFSNFTYVAMVISALVLYRRERASRK
jgi:hypothetical protein